MEEGEVSKPVEYFTSLHSTTPQQESPWWCESVCVCVSESERERLKFDSYHSGYLRTSHLGSSTVSHGRFMPTAQTRTHTEAESESEKKKNKTENGCYSSLLQQQTQTWELNVLFSLDTDQNAFYGCLYLLASLRWPSWCHRQLCWFQGFNFFCRISDINHR